MQRAFPSGKAAFYFRFLSRLILISGWIVVWNGSAFGVDVATLRSNALAEIQPLPKRMPGAENDTPALRRLGRKLYFDKRLSKDYTTSCNTCHAMGSNGTYRGETPKEFNKETKRNSPTVLNAGFHIAQFWDGRTPTLEAQAREPLVNPTEMNMPPEEELLRRIRRSMYYHIDFALAFPDDTNRFTMDNVTHAISAYERSLVTHDRFDDFLNGSNWALTRTERSGLELFLTLGCVDCHNGPLLGGNSYQKTGVRHPYADTNDIGRAKITSDITDNFKFKVPSLRNIVLTPPYFHDGKVASLTNAISQMAYLQLDKELTHEKVESIETFLHSLSDKRRSLQPKTGLLIVQQQ